MPALEGPVDLGLASAEGRGDLEVDELPLATPVPRRVDADPHRAAGGGSEEVVRRRGESEIHR